MRTVCAYSLTFPYGSAAADAWECVIAWVDGWYRSTAPPMNLPRGWENGGRIAPDIGHSIETTMTSVDGVRGPLRELRWRFPDTSDPSLVWTVEVATLPDEATAFTLLWKMASADFELVPARFQLRPPRVIRQLIERGDARVGAHPITAEPRKLAAEDILSFTTLLVDPSRRHPIVLVSPQAYSDDEYATDPEALALQLVGLASVFVLGSRWADYALSDELGCYEARLMMGCATA